MVLVVMIALNLENGTVDYFNYRNFLHANKYSVSNHTLKILFNTMKFFVCFYFP